MDASFHAHLANLAASYAASASKALTVDHTLPFGHQSLNPAHVALPAQALQNGFVAPTGALNLGHLPLPFSEEAMVIDRRSLTAYATKVRSCFVGGRRETCIAKNSSYPEPLTTLRFFDRPYASARLPLLSTVSELHSMLLDVSKFKPPACGCPICSSSILVPAAKGSVAPRSPVPMSDEKSNSGWRPGRFLIWLEIVVCSTTLQRSPHQRSRSFPCTRQ